jgi:hypothetical protein
MKTLFFSLGILALITYAGIPSLVDDNLVSGITALWNVHMQKAVIILIGLSIVAYATVYIYYACRHRDKPSSR